MTKKSLHSILHQVPPEYYQEGVKRNALQRTWHTRKLDVVLSLFPKKNSSNVKILDAGCASGWFVNEVSRKYPKAICHGIDLYDKAIKYGAKQYPHITFKTGDCHNLPYRANTFDIIFCTEVIEHVEDPKKVLSEIYRTLKPNGTAIIEMDSGSPLFRIVWWVWTHKPGAVWQDAHIHPFRANELEKTIRSNGFKIKKKRMFNLGMAVAFALKK